MNTYMYVRVYLYIYIYTHICMWVCIYIQDTCVYTLYMKNTQIYSHTPYTMQYITRTKMTLHHLVIWNIMYICKYAVYAQYVHMHNMYIYISSYIVISYAYHYGWLGRIINLKCCVFLATLLWWCRLVRSFNLQSTTGCKRWGWDS